MKKGENFIYTLGEGLYINLTNKCSNDCSFCLRRGGDGVGGATLWLSREPSAKEVIELLKGYPKPYSEAVFCGYGESTYKLQELKEVALFLKSAGKRVRLNTNGLGSAINGFDIVPTLSTCVDTVYISLNEADERSYNELCKPIFGDSAYGYILDFARSCVSARIETVMTVVDVIGEERVERCRQICKETGARLKVRTLITDNASYS